MSDQYSSIESLKKPLPTIINSVGWGFLLLGAACYALGYLVDARHAAFVHVVNFLFLTSIGIGALFLIALEYIAGAVWSVPMRRVNEFLATLTPIAALMALPLYFHLNDLYRWVKAETVAHDAVLKVKEPYLNVNFFTFRFVVIFGLWTLFLYLFTRNSQRQDIDKDQKHTKFNIGLAAAFMPIFAIGLTLIAIDWAMSLEPHWYSTIYGVYYFSGTILAGISAATYIIVKLHEHGYFPQLRRDHFYSLGTLIFVFVNFWAYIAFSQFLLIWYANLPEETYWFIARWKNGWEYISMLLIVVHFAVPYFMLLSQDSKMDLKRLKFMSIWVLFAHLLDLYWLVMPSYSTSPVVSWMEISFPLLIVGLVIVTFSWKMKRQNLIPIGDPKLERGLEFRL
ncbi:MAG: quinol:cytochrome C oxidoreductase [Ignavibacteriales bacterium]|nr:quinol:cytochrome C oxidoreductase [Ignavibacteriales bacterium]